MDAVPTWDQVPSLDAGNGSVAVGLKVSKHRLEINTDIQKHSFSLKVLCAEIFLGKQGRIAFRNIMLMQMWCRRTCGSKERGRRGTMSLKVRNLAGVGQCASLKVRKCVNPCVFTVNLSARGGES